MTVSVAILANGSVALQHRNYRLICIGLLVPITGSTMQNAACLVHVSSPAPPAAQGIALGIVGLVKVVPILIVFDGSQRGRGRCLEPTPPDVVHADRGPRCRWRWRGWPLVVSRKCGRFTRSWRWVPPLRLFHLPARQALVATSVPREHLPNAISLNTIGCFFTAASVAGPSLRPADCCERYRRGLRCQRFLVRLRGLSRC